MALSKELEAELTKFFLFKLWPVYPTDLCGDVRKKGPKGQAKKAFLKIPNIDMDEAERILTNLKEQVRYDRKQKDPARWPYMTTYLNQARYDDEITCLNADPEAPVSEIQTCSEEGCERECIGPRFNKCPEHWAKDHDPWIDMRKRKMEDLGLLPHTGETKTEYYERVKAWCKSHLDIADIIGG